MSAAGAAGAAGAGTVVVVVVGATVVVAAAVVVVVLTPGVPLAERVTVVVALTIPAGRVVITAGTGAGGVVTDGEGAMLVVVTVCGVVVDTTVVVGAIVVVGATVVVVVRATVVVVVVVAGGDVAGTEVEAALPVQGNGVPQLKVVAFTLVTARPIELESTSRPAASVARSRSLVSATGVIGPAGVNADVYSAVPFTKWKFEMRPPK